jgi:E-phenylitaconyl-CoA hydratase
MPAQRAYELGLVDEIAETPADALAVADELAEAMLQNSPQAMSLSKLAVWGALERSYGDALEYAWSLLRLHWAHPDFQEGPRAFVEKRDPRWNADPNAREQSAESKSSSLDKHRDGDGSGTPK